MASSHRGGGPKGTTCFYATPFAFSTEEKKKLGEKFEASREGRKAEKEDRGPGLFVLRFAAADTTAMDNFAMIVEAHLRQSGNQIGAFEETTIRRQKGTMIAMSDHSDITTDSDTSSSADEALIGNETTKKEWFPSRIYDDELLRTISEQIVNEAILKEIATSTHCRLEPKPSRRTIIVRGEDAYHVDLALGKLTAEWIFLAQKASLPITYDFGISEGEYSAMLQMLPLKELKDRRLAKTLVSPNAGFIKSLRNYLVVVMIKDGIVYPAGPPRPIDRDSSIESDSKLWPTSTTKPTQITPLENPITKLSLPAIENIFNPYLEPRKTGHIKDWVEQSAAQATSDPFEPPVSVSTIKPDVVSEQPDQGQSQMRELNNEQTSPRRRAGRMRRPRGAVNEVSADMVEAPPPPPLADVNDVLEGLASASPLPSMQTARSPPLQAGTSVQPVQAATGLLSAQAATLPSPDLAATSLPPTIGSEAGFRRPTFNPNAYRAVRTPTAAPSVQSRATSRRPNQLPELQSPYMPAASTTSSFKSTVTPTPWADTNVPAVEEGQLVDLTEPDSVEAPRDRIRRTNGAAPHQRYNTMRQRKPSGQVGSGSSGAIASYDKMALQMLEVVRSARGKVDIRTSIGRLLINNTSGHSDFRKNRFATSQWSQAFPNRQDLIRFRAVLIERLTALGSDADYIVDLKLASGRRMFTEEPCLRKTIYRIVCSTSHNAEDDVIINVEEKEIVSGNAEVWKASSLYGVMNWFFPKRQWDARLTVDVNNHVNQEQRLAAQEVVKNLRISPSEDNETLQLTTKITSSSLEIQGIELRQETHHRSSQYPDLVLVLSQVQELEIAHKTESSDEYLAYTNSRAQMVHEHRRWFEASIASALATKRFQENQALGVGEKVAWTAKDIVEPGPGLGVIRNMSLLASDIVMAIDSVGYVNKGPKVATAKELSEAPPSLSYW